MANGLVHRFMNILSYSAKNAPLPVAAPIRAARVSKRLMSGVGIPESEAKVGEVGTARVGGIREIGAAQEVERDPHGAGQEGGGKADAGSGFDEIGPVLALDVAGDVGVPVELCVAAESVAQAGLAVDQEIVEAAHKNRIEAGIDEPA